MLSRNKNPQTEIFYGSGYDVKKSAKKTDIEKTDGNSLMAKAMTPKKFNKEDSIGTTSMIKFHGKHFYG